MTSERPSVKQNGNIQRLESAIPLDRVPITIHDELTVFLQSPEVDTLGRALQFSRAQLGEAKTSAIQTTLGLTILQQEHQIILNALQDQFRRYAPTRLSALPRDPRKEIRAGDTHAVRTRIRVLLGAARPENPGWIRLLAKFFGMNEHPLATEARVKLAEVQQAFTERLASQKEESQQIEIRRASLEEEVKNARQPFP